MDRVLKSIQTGGYTAVILLLVTACTLLYLKSAEGTFINGRDGAGTITCNSLGQSAPAIMILHRSVKKVIRALTDRIASLVIPHLKVTGGVDNVNSVNKAFYNLTYHGKAENCPPSDVIFNSTISGSCGQNASVKFISKVIRGEFVGKVTCME